MPQWAIVTDRLAIVAAEGMFSYADLDAVTSTVAAGLLGTAADLDEARVAFLVPPSFAHVAVARGIWRAGGIAVPLGVSHPPAELDYVIRDADASIVIGDPPGAQMLEPIVRAVGARFGVTTELLAHPGATCEMLPTFDAEATWARLASGEVTVFTAVPTIYHRLIASWDAAPPAVQRSRSEGCRRARLMMSGSAALPVQTLERWREISG